MLILVHLSVSPAAPCPVTVYTMHVLMVIQAALKTKSSCAPLAMHICYISVTAFVCVCVCVCAPVPARVCLQDPKAKKPEDWDEREKIPDPEDKKPAGWDDIPATIVDPDAKKPEDWNDEDDGEWKAPTIPNPEYKGEWKPKM